jgi:hypothetical protein
MQPKTSIAAVLVPTAVLAFLLLIPPPAYSQTPGLPWVVQRISPRGEAGTFPDIAADSAGNLHVVWLSRPGENTSQPSTDLMYARYDGRTWTTPLSVLVVDGGSTPRVVIDRQGWLHLTLGIGQSLMYTRVHSSQAGNTRNWLPPKPLSSIAFFGGQALLFDSTGILHVVYQNFNSSTLEYLQSTDGGNSWSAPMVLAQETGTDNKPAVPDLIEDQQGVLHLVWSMTQAPSYYGGEGVYYMRSTDRGRNWSSPYRLDKYADGRNDNAWLAGISEVAPRKLVVVWDRHAETGLRIFAVSNDGGLRWESPKPVPGKITLQTGLNPMLKDGAGNLFLFNAGTGQGVSGSEHYVLMNRWGGSSWGTVESVSGAPGAHYLRGVVTHGNELNLVWGSLSGYRGAIFYARGITDAPYQAGKPVPTVEPTATPTVTTPTQTPRPNSTRILPPSQLPAETISPSDVGMMQTLVWGVLPVVLLVLAVVLVRLRASGR